MSSTSQPRIVLTRPLPEPWIATLRAASHLVVGDDRPGFDDRLRAAMRDADGVLTLLTEVVDAALLDQAPGLRVVSNMAVGVDNIDLAACAQRSIAVGHTPGVLTDATADLTLALLLGAARRISEAATDARAGRWGTWSPTGWLGSELRGKTLGVVGLGAIGRAVALRASAFGMRIVYCRRAPAAPPTAGAQQLDLDALLATADIVSLHVPLSPSTRGLIGTNALERMKPSALLINTARGPVVDTNALVQALRTGSIAGAALDVTDPEPLPAGHPLYALPNALVTPHVGSATWATRERMAQLAIANVLAGVRGAALPHAVPPPSRA